MGIKSEGVQRDIVKRRLEKRVGREVGQDLQVDLGPGARGRSPRMLEEKLITRELYQYGGC